MGCSETSIKDFSRRIATFKDRYDGCRKIVKPFNFELGEFPALDVKAVAMAYPASKPRLTPAYQTMGAFERFAFVARDDDAVT